jgi:hypothetical protein
MEREYKVFDEIHRTPCMSETSTLDQVDWPVLLSKYTHNTSLGRISSGSRTHLHLVYVLPAAF